MYTDDRHLPYGKWKNMTPNQLFDRGEHEYLKWLYENTRYEIISKELYKRCCKSVKDNGSEDYWES